MTIENFIAAISTIPYRSLDNEFDFAKQKKALVIPHLLGILEKTVEDLKNDSKSSNESRSSYVIAIYLLAFFREKKTYPLIIYLLNNMSGRFDQNLFHDELEDMPNILASTFDGNIELIFQLIENTNAYLFARIAALDSLIALWQTKQITRESVISYFDKLLVKSFKEKNDDEMLLWIIHSALRLYPEEIIDSIRLAFYFLGEDIYYPTDPLILPDEFEKAMKNGKDYVLKNYLEKDNFHIITDLSQEFEDWCWFKPESVFQFKAAPVLNPLEDEDKDKEEFEEEIIFEDEDTEDEDFMFLGDEKHMAYCHKLYGDFNKKGLESLQDKYDTAHLKHVRELARELQYQVNELNENIELMDNAARELIDGESPFHNDYEINEQGDIGYFAHDLYETASSIEDVIAQISKKIAPLSRLLDLFGNSHSANSML